MISIGNISISVGTIIKLPKDWLNRIFYFTRSVSFEESFIISSIVEEKFQNETFYVCTSLDTNSTEKIILTKYAVLYILGSKIQDSNVGLYFSEYLPEDNSKILITSVQNPSEVVPAIFRFKPELIVLNGESNICIRIVFDFINGSGFASIKYYLNGYSLYKWKYLFNRDDSYMTDYEKMFQDTLIHKDFIIKSCDKLAKYLDEQGAHNYAEKLRKRALVHDDSKISDEEELRALSFIINDKTNMQNPDIKISPIVRDAIKIHWKNNSHHPEHYESYLDMTKLDIMEMCCDWYARSMQYKTNFLEFVKKRQEDRFHFPDWMFAEIWHYCEVLNSDS